MRNYQNIPMSFLFLFDIKVKFDIINHKKIFSGQFIWGTNFKLIFSGVSKIDF
jgi:hypothetical protein